MDGVRRETAEPSEGARAWLLAFGPVWHVAAVFAGVALFLAMGLRGATQGPCGATLAGLAVL